MPVHGVSCARPSLGGGQSRSEVPAVGFAGVRAGEVRSVSAMSGEAVLGCSWHEAVVQASNESNDIYGRVIASRIFYC